MRRWIAAGSILVGVGLLLVPLSLLIGPGIHGNLVAFSGFGLSEVLGMAIVGSALLTSGVWTLATR